MYKEERINITGAAVFWLMTVSYMGLIFFLSSRHSFDLPRLPGNFDKVVHMGVYLVLAFLLHLSMARSGMKKYVFVAAFILASLYGVTDALHQSFVPGRDATVGDALADTLGAFLGSYGASLLKV